MLASTSPQRPGEKGEDTQEHEQRGCGQKSGCCGQGGTPGAEIHGGRSRGAAHRGAAFEQKPNPRVFLALELLGRIPGSPEATSISPLAPAEPEFPLRPLQETPQRSEAQTPSDNVPRHTGFLCRAAWAGTRCRRGREALPRATAGEGAGVSLWLQGALGALQPPVLSILHAK